MLRKLLSCASRNATALAPDNNNLASNTLTQSPAKPTLVDALDSAAQRILGTKCVPFEIIELIAQLVQEWDLGKKTDCYGGFETATGYFGEAILRYIGTESDPSNRRDFRTAPRRISGCQVFERGSIYHVNLQIHINSDPRHMAGLTVVTWLTLNNGAESLTVWPCLQTLVGLFTGPQHVECDLLINLQDENNVSLFPATLQSRSRLLNSHDQCWHKESVPTEVNGLYLQASVACVGHSARGRNPRRLAIPHRFGADFIIGSSEIVTPEAADALEAMFLKRTVALELERAQERREAAAYTH